MRWTAFPKRPRQGYTIVVRKFLWWPMQIGQDKRWLESASIEWEYRESSYWRGECKWIALRFVDTEQVSL